jgi:hypothetical protein
VHDVALAEDPSLVLSAGTYALPAMENRASRRSPPGRPPSWEQDVAGARPGVVRRRPATVLSVDFEAGLGG